LKFAAYFNSAPVVNSAALIPLPSLTPASVVDILVVAFLIYQALMIVKGTRAGHILIGILIMVALYVVALYTGLEALRSVLSYIVPYLALAVRWPAWDANAGSRAATSAPSSPKIS
jgi:DNA integrity scanning protein DisA with diadenylate cyclase activity